MNRFVSAGLAALALAVAAPVAQAQNEMKLDPRYHMTPDQVSLDSPFGDIEVTPP
jgi:hypothetical protein